MRFRLVLVTSGLALVAAVGAGRAERKAADVPTPEALAGRAKEVFRAHCLECHGGGKVRGGVQILDHAGLVKKEKLAPGKPDDSVLFQLITAQDESVMPPSGQPRLAPEEVDSIRKWIAAGAPPFPADVAPPAPAPQGGDAKGAAGDEYVFRKILAHVRGLNADDRRFVRYFALNHLLAGGATADELDLHREALAKVVNHLSWEPAVALLQPVDPPAATIYAIDIRKVGWHLQPFERIDGGLSLGKAKENLFDLALLEYPYAVQYKDSDAFDRVAEEYLAPADLARPVPFVRADWFVGTATQPGLYHDFLQLPFALADLEQRLGVDSAANLKSGVARRAGMTVSGVSRNNRVVERHPARYGYYWKSFDFKSNRGPENMFKDPIHFKESGGEMIFALPNGLQAYYVADTRGTRLDAAPTEIVVDKFADDKIVRNGIGCIRCHDAGTKTFLDTVRPALLSLPGTAGFDKREALQLYSEQKEMDEFLNEDGKKFLAAMQKALGKPQTREPVIPVARRYHENPLQLSTAAGELGLPDATGLTSVFRSPQFTGLGLLPLATAGVVRRDAWEEYFDQAVRGLGLGVPVVPLDGTVRRDYPAANPPFEVALTTNKKNNIFEPGDELRITVTNKSEKTLFVELIGTSAQGKKVILVNPKTKLEPGKKLQFPENGPLKIKGGLGREQITLFASDVEFPAGQLLRGKDVTDRVVHAFQTLQRKDGRVVIDGDPARVVKRTLEIETR